MKEEEIKAYLATVYPDAVWQDTEVPVMEVNYSFEDIVITEQIKTLEVAVQ